MESEARERTSPVADNTPGETSAHTNCQEEVTEEFFVSAHENELAPHAPTGLKNPFWSA